METVLYTSLTGMFRVVEKDGAYYPQEQSIFCSSYCDGRIRSMRTVTDLIAAGQVIQGSGWKGYFLGYQQFSTVSKGFKSFKSLQLAIKFVDRQSENV